MAGGPTCGCPDTSPLRRINGSFPQVNSGGPSVVRTAREAIGGLLKATQWLLHESPLHRVVSLTVFSFCQAARLDGKMAMCLALYGILYFIYALRETH